MHTFPSQRLSAFGADATHGSAAVLKEWKKALRTKWTFRKSQNFHWYMYFDFVWNTMCCNKHSIHIFAVDSNSSQISRGTKARNFTGNANNLPVFCISCFFTILLCHQAFLRIFCQATQMPFRFQFKFINKIMIIYGQKWYCSSIWAFESFESAWVYFVFAFSKDKNQIMWNLYDDTIATIIWIMMSKHDTVLYSYSYRKSVFLSTTREKLNKLCLANRSSNENVRFFRKQSTILIQPTNA